MSHRKHGTPRRYGLWDGKGWLGTPDGPLLFRNRDIAAVAATVHSIHLVSGGDSSVIFAVRRFRDKTLIFNGATYREVTTGHDALLVAEGEMSEGKARRLFRAANPED